MKYKVLFIGIIILGCILRFYKLGEIPKGLYQDETAIGWNAYSILDTGKDEHGNAFPIYFKSFGDYKLPVYVYITAIMVKFFGLTAFAVRLPSALFGVLTLPAFYFLVKHLTKKESLALLSTTFLAINPWHLHYSRAAFEVSIVLFLFTLGILFFHQALHKKRGAFIGSVLLFILAIYTYNLTRLLSPIVFFGLLILYRNHLKDISLRERIIAIVIGTTCLIPFIMTYFTKGGISSATGTLIFTSAAVQAPLLEFRSYLVDIPLINKLIFNSITLTLWQYLINIVSYFSIPFFFITGSSHGNHGIGTTGQLYLFELPLVLYGIYTFLRSKYQEMLPFFLVGIATVLVASLTREAPHATRSFTLLLFFPVISAYGLIAFLKRIKKERYLVRYATSICFILIAIFSVMHYASSYYRRFPVLFAKQWREQDKNVSLYIKEQMETYDQIIIDKEAGFIYSSLLFYTQYSPMEFQHTVIRNNDDSEGMSEVVSFGKFHYRTIDWKTEDIKSKTLYITRSENLPEYPVSQKTFLYPGRPVVIALKQDIVQYPTQETAYVAITSLK
jgi:4-amino-4-deoxy-L-arabinose transferase-like glycosyltransferase